MKMNEDQKRSADVSLALLTSLITVVGIVIGVWQFNAGEEHKATLESAAIKEKDFVDFKRKLWLERLATYRSIASVAGKLASHPARDKTREGYVNDFEASYWGTMPLVEDQDVEKAMIQYRLVVRDYQQGVIGEDRLKIATDKLGGALKTSLEIELKQVESPSTASK
jgi:hypothetical protein